QGQLQRSGAQLVPKHPARDRRATVEQLLTCLEAIDLQRCSDVSPQVQDQLQDAQGGADQGAIRARPRR
ncbi:hypothetical protein, partial [Burkholderia cepacia]|uniref:hypothetical protein n=1 Tax=Burkholderia cepacia TaxID=292 RepID=UPI001ABA4E4B